MQFCLDPFVRFGKGEAKKHDKTANKVLRDAVACGRCKACVSNRKQDWTGKLLAEGETAGACVFVTLTYRIEPDHFPYDDVKGMLKRLRAYLWRKNRCKVRFFCVAERGDLHARRHWHLILFLSRPVVLKRTTPGRLWGPALQDGLKKDDDRKHFWPHGWTSLEMLSDIDRRAQKMRYCVMYSLKGIGMNVGERARCSLDPALGDEYIRRQARKWVDAGLPPNGKYNIPGVIWNKGHKAGQRQDFSLMGANRRNFIRHWRDWWSCVRPTEPHPVNAWLLQWDDRSVDPVHAKAAIRAAARRASGVPTRARVLKDRPAVDLNQLDASRVICGDGWSVTLVKLRGGRAFVYLDDSPQWEVYESIAEVLDLDAPSVVRVDKWLRDQRGPYWMRPVDGETLNEADGERKRLRSLVLREVVGDSIRRLRDRHGTVAGIGGIYGRPLQPGSNDPFWGFVPRAFSPVKQIHRETDIACEVCGVLHPRKGSCKEGCDTETALRFVGLHGQSAPPF